MRVLVLGAGGHAQVVADILQCQKLSGQPVTFVGYVDDRFRELRATLGDAVLGPIGDWTSVDHDVLVVAVGDNSVRRDLFERAAAGGASFDLVRHPASTVASDVSVGRGSMICAGVVINTRAVVGINTIVNTSASVDHHCRIGDHVHLAPGVRLGGDVTVGEGAFVGLGAVVLPGTTIGAWATVGAGAVVTRDVAPRDTVVGVPARPLGVRVP